MLRGLLPALLAGCWLAGPSAHPSLAGERRPRSAAEDFFEKQVRPLLADNCQECHGSKKQRGGLRLDSRAALMTGGDTGPAVVPGKPDESLLIKAVHYAGEPKMPPKAKLEKQQIAALVEWVRQGAPWPVLHGRPAVATLKLVLPPDQQSALAPFSTVAQPWPHSSWSFRPISDPPLPKVADAAWPQTSVDYFILSALEAKKLRPVAAADRRTLIRRATFDLTGLPPAPEEIEAFLKDDKPGAFARVVDRLLSSPHYGERWGRHWLDVARYGEDQAHTFAARLYPQGYRYRDWVVKAFNDDMPYDRFIKEQIAADLLPGPGLLERLPALGFFALGPVYYGDPKKLDQYDDRIDTLSRGFLGLTVACARCHDHKFDPISQKDYYGLAGIVASTDYVEAPLVPPQVVEEAKKKLTAEEKKKKVPPKYPFAHAIKETNAVTLKVHLRGNPQTLGEEAPHRFLEVLAPDSKPFGKGSGRLELAEAIASKDNPLTARVFVNRVWQHHFGTGLVRTASNFGALGERPSHPELLEHLATRFLASGWSIKQLHREILLSATYQLASVGQASSLPGAKAGWKPAPRETVDPENRLLWRMNRRRLEVEAWRDAMLAVAGTLDRTVGGPSTRLADPNNRRRTLYGAISRHELDNLLRLFDFPDPNITSGERSVTTVPLQQLFVLNSEFMVGNAKALVARLADDPHDAERIRRAFVVLYARPPTAQELQMGLEFLSAGTNAAKGEAGQLTRWEQYAQVLLSANEFLYVD
ncbi:MAG: PSD1 domain-containing protein [Planctomycetes bacterium]|nr:PSD1 domain-containing protein [Planctomycetota bacterium]